MVRSPIADDEAFARILNQHKVLVLPGTIVETPGLVPHQPDRVGRHGRARHPGVRGGHRLDEMKVSFVAGFGPDRSRSGREPYVLGRRRPGHPAEGRSPGYFATDGLEGVKYFSLGHSPKPPRTRSARASGPRTYQCHKPGSSSMWRVRRPYAEAAEELKAAGYRCPPRSATGGVEANDRPIAKPGRTAGRHLVHALDARRGQRAIDELDRGLPAEAEVQRRAAEIRARMGDGRSTFIGRVGPRADLAGRSVSRVAGTVRAHPCPPRICTWRRRADRARRLYVRSRASQPSRSSTSR